ncbi:MAG: hypothetical protein FWG73_02500 [Planctomycetaceae bacterium]|nr:hypothetical protein [Planctomycetaceae bacterium]
MARFLGFSLLLLFALPVFAQGPVGDAAMLQRMQGELTAQLQETQHMLSLVGPTDRRLAEVLQTRQADLTRQLRDVMQQLQVSGQNEPMMERAEMPQGRGGRDETMPNATMTNAMPAEMPPGMWGGMPAASPMPQPGPGMWGGMGMPPMSPMSSAGLPPSSPPHWGMVEQPPSWDATPWGPRLPRELTEMRQSVDLLKREVGELRETVKALEAQIQLLNRNILLFDRVRDLEEPY